MTAGGDVASDDVLDALRRTAQRSWWRLMIGVGCVSGVGGGLAGATGLLDHRHRSTHGHGSIVVRSA